MKNFFLTLVAVIALTGLFSATSFADSGGKGNPVDCARQYRNCLKYCSQMEASAKHTKADCEKAAKQQYPNGGAAYNAAIKACRDAYNAAMKQVAECRANCQREYEFCTGGGYGER